MQISQLNKSKKMTEKQRIIRVLNFYYKRGINYERVNNLYRKIIKNGKVRK